MSDEYLMSQLGFHSLSASSTRQAYFPNFNNYFCETPLVKSATIIIRAIFVFFFMLLVSVIHRVLLPRPQHLEDQVRRDSPGTEA